MKPLNIKQCLFAGLSAVALAACGGDKEASSSGSTAASGSTKGKVVYAVVAKKVVTRGNPSQPERGLGCSIGMKLANNTDRKKSLIQILNYTAKTSQGDISGRGVNFRLEPNETTDRAALYVKGVTCDDVEKIKIEKIVCNNAGAQVISPDYSCASNVIFQNGKTIKFDVSDEARKPLITVSQ